MVHSHWFRVQFRPPREHHHIFKFLHLPICIRHLYLWNIISHLKPYLNKESQPLEMPARRIFLDSWANRPPWPKSIDFPCIQLRGVHEAACYQSNFTKRLLNSTSPMHRVFEQISTSPRQVCSLFPLPSHILFRLLHLLTKPRKQ